MTRVCARALRGALLVAATCVSIAACGTEDPVAVNGPSIAGAWTTRLPVGEASDSLMLLLADSATAVTAIGYFSSLRATTIGGAGTITEGHLYLALGSASGAGAAVTLTISADRDGDAFSGVAVAFGQSYPIQLRRAANAGALAGTWVLATTRGGAAVATADTVVLEATGGAHRGFAGASCGWSVPGAAHAAAGWVHAEYFSSFGYGPPCAPPTRDSLQVVGDTLVRRTALTGGATREELYLRR